MDYIRNCHNPDHWFNVIAYGDCWTCDLGKQVREEVAMELLIQSVERENMRKLTSEYPEFVNYGREVTEQEANPM